jgi:outer membrane lipoprotein carrier protein
MTYIFFILLFFTIYPNKAFSSQNHFIKSYQKISSWQANFVQETYVPLLDQKISKTGSIIISKPGKIRIDYLTPIKKTYLSNGKKLWIQIEGDPLIKEFSNLKKALSSEAFELLMKNQISNQDFKMMELENENHLSVTSFIPKEEKSIFKKIVFKLDLKQSLIKEMILDNKSGNQTLYRFSEIRTNQKFGDELFEIDQLKK